MAVDTPATTPAEPRARLRDRVATSLVRLSKVFGNTVPTDIETAEAAAGMTPASPFSPGEPIGPYDGYSRTPRAREIVTGYNINTRPRSHERIPFTTLRGLIEAYDIAQIAIWHRIDSIRALDWSLVPADGYRGDAADAIAQGTAVLTKPDHSTPFDAWLAAYLYDVLAYDAGTLWRMRDRAGRVVGLRTIDGTTIAPLQDYWGDPPAAPAPAYVQYANGLPWNWLTTRDLVYQPFRRRNNSPYGQAPLETVILNANTDLRFQAYFLQRFTDGNIPAAFASAPETWSPQQIEQFQTYWDGFILGDQAAKSQVKWIPGGSKIEFTNEREFSDAFSLFLMRKTLAALHVVPADLGFTETVNRSSGETQSDVQHRIGDAPLARHVSGILTRFLQDDLRLPVKHQFDLGEEQDDRLNTAQADDLYVKMGAISPSDIRELRYGLTDPVRVPRFIFSNRGGPVPLSALDAVAGPTDPESGAPQPGAPLPRTVFQPVEGVEANPPTPRPPLAVQLYGPGALPVAAPQSAPPPSQPPTGTPLAKDGPPAGITAATGITSYDLVGHEDDEPRDAVEKEMARFRRHVKQCRRPGRRWRDFEFATVGPGTAQRLNNQARFGSTVAKSTPGVAERSGMISLDLPDGAIPHVPGGVQGHHITVVYLGSDIDDDAFAAACERARVAASQTPGPLAGVVAGVDSFEPSAGSGGKVPAFAPVALPGVHALRIALADLSASEHTDYHPHVTLAFLDDGDPLPPAVPATPVTFTHLTVHRGAETRTFPFKVQDAAPVAKAAAPVPKGGAPDQGAAAGQWAGWRHDHATATHWAPHVARVLNTGLTLHAATRLARDYAAEQPGPRDGRTDAELADAALAWLTLRGVGSGISAALTPVLRAIRTDGCLLGAASAAAMLDGTPAPLGNWKPGDTDEAEQQLAALDGADPGPALSGSDQTAQQITDTHLRRVARALALGVIAGHAPGVVAAAMLAIAARDSDGISLTELLLASGLAVFGAYKRRRIPEVVWVIDPRSKVCQACLTNSDYGAVRLGQAFPSGHTTTPAHNRCACSLQPA